MSVMSETVGRPAPVATVAMLSASSRAAFERRHEGAGAGLHVHDQALSPAASFFDRIEAVMSATNSTVAVTSRMA